MSMNQYWMYLNEALWVGGFAAALHLINLDNVLADMINNTFGKVVPGALAGSVIVGGTMAGTVLGWRVFSDNFLSK